MIIFKHEYSRKKIGGKRGIEKAVGARVWCPLIRSVRPFESFTF